jgi:hypothetical protein
MKRQTAAIPRPMPRNIRFSTDGPVATGRVCSGVVELLRATVVGDPADRGLGVDLVLAGDLVVRVPGVLRLPDFRLPLPVVKPLAEAVVFDVAAVFAPAVVLAPPRTPGLADPDRADPPDPVREPLVVSPVPDRGRGEAEVFSAIGVTLVAAVTPVPVATPESSTVYPGRSDPTCRRRAPGIRSAPESMALPTASRTSVTRRGSAPNSLDTPITTPSRRTTAADLALPMIPRSARTQNSRRRSAAAETAPSTDSTPVAA